MAYETIIVAFADARSASSAINAVRGVGVPANSIRRHPAESGSVEMVRAAVEQESGIWKWLFGRQVTSDEAAVYEKAVESGGIVVSVSVMEEEAGRVSDILQSFGPLCIAQH